MTEEQEDLEKTITQLHLMVQSLTRQLGVKAREVAEREAVIEMMHQEDPDAEV